MQISAISSSKVHFGKPNKHPLTAEKQKILFDPNFKVSGNKQDGFSIYVAYKNLKDADKRYTFNPDGSAMCVSTAWGNKSSVAAGTLSKIYEQLPNNFRDIDDKLAKQLLDKYNEALSKKQILY